MTLAGFLGGFQGGGLPIESSLNIHGFDSVANAKIANLKVGDYAFIPVAGGGYIYQVKLGATVGSDSINQILLNNGNTLESTLYYQRVRPIEVNATGNLTQGGRYRIASNESAGTFVLTEPLTIDNAITLWNQHPTESYDVSIDTSIRTHRFELPEGGTALTYTVPPQTFVQFVQRSVNRISIITFASDMSLTSSDIVTDAELLTVTDPTKLNNAVQLKAHIDDNKKHNPVNATDGQFSRYNATSEEWEAVDLPITPQNLVSGPGAPSNALGEDGHYYIQINAAKGTNDVWGAKATGAWPAQADYKSADPEVFTQAQITSTTGVDYTTPRLASTERLDQWGLSRRVQRVFNVNAPFDFTALNYADKTAVFIRNVDNSNGINITYGTGGVNTLEIRRADGSGGTITAQDTFNVQPSEFVVMEKDGTTIRASIMPAERVKSFDTYAQANAFGALPHDGIVLIKSTKEVWGRTSATNSVLFPADGVENADWGIYGGKTNFVQTGTSAEKVALGIVPSNTPFFDTDLIKLQYYNTATDAFQVVFGTAHQPFSINWLSNSTSGSGLNFKVTENPDETTGVTSIDLPDGTEKQIWIVAQQVSGNTILIGGAGTLGGTAIVRNDGGVISLVSVPNESRWHNAGSWTTLSYNQLVNLVASPIGVTDTEIKRIFNNVAGAGVWTNLDGTLTQSQALEDFKPLTAYATGERFVAPMPLNANFINTNGAIFNVDYIFEANTDIPNTITAFDEAQADSGNYDLVGVFRVSGTQDRVLTGTGIMLLDPLADLSNTDTSEYIHWTTTDTPKTIRLVPAPAFVTIWKDYTGNNIVQPTAANEDFVLPANSQIWVHRAGNAVQITIESNEGGSSLIVDDQAALGYIDIGTTRIQWGDEPSSSGETVVFNQPFASTPVITATSTQNAGHNISVLTKSATQFTFDQWDVNNTQQNGTWNWIAIGEKD